jgi:ATP-dependent Clp protease adaptor protein ClpS
MGQDQDASSKGSTTGTLPSPTSIPGTHPAVSPPAARQLPPYRVLLHDDDIHSMGYVVLTLVQLAALDDRRAGAVMMRAHVHGVALVRRTHKERAELYQEQFRSRGLRVTIEPGA